MRGFKAVTILFLLLGFTMPRASGALQFDVMAGYGAEGCLHEGAWYPVMCEVFNDGPGFNALIEISTEGWGGGGQVRRVPVELPTNTRKRIFVPMFASASWGGAGTSVSGKLYDSGGKKRAERIGVTTRKVTWDSVVLGSLPKSFGGSPTLPDMKTGRAEMKPEVARMTIDQFPDSPIALQGLTALYLNSEKALDLKVNQITALLGWVREGGHLIVAVEEAGDINATPWLKQFLPMDLTTSRPIRLETEVINWIKNQSGASDTIDTGVTAGGRRTRRMVQPTGNVYIDLPYDSAFQGAELPVALGTLRDGDVMMTAQNAPLAVQAPRGRGKVTLLTFSPEREPFRSWKARPYFWARLAGIPGDFFTTVQNTFPRSSDGIFGALIDSRQVQKLPITWLLLLLIVYLVVIGPFDQWWLKKINRQMLTWITFPTYVVLFSVLIYFIGYKLRAGETEWNELNIVDVLPRGDKVDVWGRSYVSVYSSGNAWYNLAGQKGHAAIRAESADFNRATDRGNDKLQITQEGNSFKAEIFVPVWTSLLYVNEWFKTNDTPFLASVSEAGGAYEVELENLLDRPLGNVRVVAGQMIYDLPGIAAHEKKSVRLSPESGTRLRSFVQQNGSYYQHALDSRQSAFNSGGSTAALEDRPLTATTVSFLSYLDEVTPNGRPFITPPGLDLTAQAERGDAIVFAWVQDFTLAGKLNTFTPPRYKQDTMLRLSVPVRAKKI